MVSMSRKIAALALFFIAFLQDDLQVCDVRHSLYPEALALRALRHALGQAEGARLQVSRLH